MIASTESGGLEALLALIPFLLFAFFAVVLPVICGIIGTITEKRHYESIHAREKATAHVPVVPTPLSDDSVRIASAHMVSASMVVAPDSFRRFLANVRNFFGGRLRSYESLLDRARREAILRMKEQAPGANAIVNLRMETSRIGGMQKKKGIIAIEVLVYGTALTYASAEAGPTPPPVS